MYSSQEGENGKNSLEKGNSPEIEVCILFPVYYALYITATFKLVFNLYKLVIVVILGIFRPD